jgi:hypothetical protein
MGGLHQMHELEKFEPIPSSFVRAMQRSRDEWAKIRPETSRTSPVADIGCKSGRRRRLRG